MSMCLSRIHGLTNPVNAVRGEGHDTGDLLDLELLAGPAQTLAQRADRRGHRTAGTAQTAGIARATSLPTLATAPAARLAAGSTRGALPGAAGAGLAQDQSLRIIAVRFVELPTPAEIHAGGRLLRELLA